jgi:hypothetical protein
MNFMQDKIVNGVFGDAVQTHNQPILCFQNAIKFHYTSFNVIEFTPITKARLFSIAFS